VLGRRVRANCEPCSVAIEKQRGAWPREVTEAIWSLTCDGYGPTAVTSLLNAGDPQTGLGDTCAITRASVKEKIQALKADRGEPENDIPPGREATVISSLERQVLKVTKREIEGELEKAENGPLDDGRMIRLMGLLGKTKQSIFQAREKDPTRVRAGQSTMEPGGGLDPFSLIDKAEREKARKRGPSGEPAPDGDTTDGIHSQPTPAPTQAHPTDPGSQASGSTAAPSLD
jgi:hypothetical protein